VSRSTVDANVLIFASHGSSPHHDAAEAFLQRLAGGPDIFYLFWPVVMAYLRISTHPSVFGEPLGSVEAAANVSRLLANANVRTVGEQETFWQRYGEVTSDVKPTGNLVSDAHLVALMRENEVRTIWTHDRDFRKFDGIEVRDPFA
jgi:toxin-antitoxin system PIN domain toxin